MTIPVLLGKKEKGARMRPRSLVLERYWVTYFCDRHCTLCGNTGIIDTRGVKTPAGMAVGRLNWCICPNGMERRAQARKKRPTKTYWEEYNV